MATMVHSVRDSHRKLQGLGRVLRITPVTYYIGIAGAAAAAAATAVVDK